MNDFAEGNPQRFRDGQEVLIAGVVASYKTRTTRNNTLMSYIQLEDDTGSMELLAFQRALDSGGSYVQDAAPLLVRGKISLRDEKEPQVMVDSIRPLSDLDVPGRTAVSPAPPGGEAGREAAHALCAHPERGPSALPAGKAPAHDVPREREDRSLYGGYEKAPRRAVPHPPGVRRRAGRAVRKGKRHREVIFLFFNKVLNKPRFIFKAGFVTILSLA